MIPTKEEHPCNGCKHALLDTVTRKEHLRYTCAVTWRSASGTCARFEHEIKPTPPADSIVQRLFGRIVRWIVS